LLDYLVPASPMLDGYELDKMRYRWRKWLYFPCNWKTALEAFNESYHVQATHPQLLRWVDNIHWSRAGGKHAWHGVTRPRDGGTHGHSGLGGVNVRGDDDPRVAAAELMNELLSTLDATTTQTLTRAAERLVDELPAGLSAGEVAAHMFHSAATDDAARGVIWPRLTPEEMEQAGADWHLFPNTVLLQGFTFALCYRARPAGYDPNRCIFEVYVLERFPEGEEPETEWVFDPDATEANWRRILSQDFSNMADVQRGMKSRGFAGARPNPVQEVAVSHFHRVLAQYMGTGAPEPL
jgi:hypothetical protein